MAVFNREGKIVEQLKTPTDNDYPNFLKDLRKIITEDLAHHRFFAGCVAAPGQIDHKTNVALRFGNLPWKNVNIVRDIESIQQHTPFYIQNDAKLAGLSEALEHPRYSKVVYLTISTGIGIGVIINGVIDPSLSDSEPGQMMVSFDGKYYKWEDLASGKALVARSGLRASEIEDKHIWRQFSKHLALGMNELIAVLQPEIIILGGGVGAHYEKYSKFLTQELNKLSNDMVVTPPIIKAKRAEEAVVYGCYEYIKQMS